MTVQGGRNHWRTFDYFSPTAVCALEDGSLCGRCGKRFDEHIEWGREALCPTYELCGFRFCQGGRWHQCRLDKGHTGDHVCNRPNAMYYAQQGQPVGVPTEDMISADGVAIPLFGQKIVRVSGRAVRGVVPESLAFHLCVGESK